LAALTAHLTARGITVEDWMGRLPEGYPSGYAYRHDGHWSADGHAYFSALLEEALVKFLPASCTRARIDSVGTMNYPRL
jgi:hypothetical protein